MQTEPRGTVTELWRYPVKSMRGDRLRRTEVTECFGIPGDRGWALRDETAGEIRGAKQLPALLQLHARYLAAPVEGSTPHVEITFPDGSTAISDDPEIDAMLSEAVGRPVSLWPRRPARDQAHYRKAGRITEPDLRKLLDLDAGEALPDFSSVVTPYSQEVVAQMGTYATPPGSYFDLMPLSLLSATSLRSLQDLLPDSRIDSRRFRKNLIIEVPDADDPFPEQAWVGRTVRIGSVRALVTGPVSRCVMVTLPQDDLPKDRAVLKTLAREAGMNFGVYLRVLERGRIAEGDSVVPMPT